MLLNEKSKDLYAFKNDNNSIYTLLTNGNEEFLNNKKTNISVSNLLHSKLQNFEYQSNLVQERRLELPQLKNYYHLKVARLPIPPSLHIKIKMVPLDRIELSSEAYHASVLPLN